jgi:hypothetical protein
MEATLFEKFVDNIIIGWFNIRRKFTDWIYPGYCIKNLFRRYDLIKIKSLRPYEYAEPDYLMFEANMELIVKFIEECEPEKHICWYTDEDGEELGHKYGENINLVMMFPEYKDKWIMDIIKEIYHWYKETLYNTKEDIDYLRYVLSTYIFGELTTKICDDGSGLYKVVFDKKNAIKELKEFEDKNIYIDWKTIDKYVKNRKDILDETKFHRIIQEMEFQLERDKQKYLHLCVEVRPYLWT